MHSRVTEPGIAAYGKYIGRQDLFLWQMVWISENPCLPAGRRVVCEHLISHWFHR